jgi:hypothetical protein
VKIDLNERDAGRLARIAKYRGMTSEYCAVGLIQQSLKKWEQAIEERTKSCEIQNSLKNTK